MREWINKILQDYRDSRGPGEDFLEWFLKRKARLRVRFLFAYVLWGIWIGVWFRPDYLIFVLEVVFLLALCYGLFEVGKLIYRRLVLEKGKKF